MAEFVSRPRWFSCINIRLTWGWWWWGERRKNYQGVTNTLTVVIVLWCVLVSELTKMYILNRCSLYYISTKLFKRRIKWRAWDLAFLALWEKHCSILTLDKPISISFLNDFQIFFFGQDPSWRATGHILTLFHQVLFIIAAWLLSSTILTKLLLQGS